MTNYEEFKAIADDIAEMYASGYSDYAEYFSETFSGIGEISAVSRLSDRVYALRGVDTKSVEFTRGLKEIAIDAMLAIGEVNIIPTKAGKKPFLKNGARYWCKKSLLTESLGVKSIPLAYGCVYKYCGGLKFKNESNGVMSIVDLDDIELSEYLQKIIEKK